MPSALILRLIASLQLLARPVSVFLSAYVGALILLALQRSRQTLATAQTYLFGVRSNLLTMHFGRGLLHG